MDAKKLYWSAKTRFLNRNIAILPQIQLQHGRLEKWFVPEFVAAMNSALGEAEAPTDLREAVADTEHQHIDICVWEGKAKTPAAIYEAKIIYKANEADGFVAKAASQLGPCWIHPDLDPDKRIGLFLIVFRKKCQAPETGCDHSNEIKKLTKAVRTAVRKKFVSDHNIRITELTPLSQIEYADETWHTQSWLTWGFLKS